MINWLKKIFKYTPKFKEGDVIILSLGEKLEEWERAARTHYLVSKLGENNYLLIICDSKYSTMNGLQFTYPFKYLDSIGEKIKENKNERN